jgi:hypothetical protein
LAVLIVSTQERKVPKLLQRINKALGLPKKSEVLWGILTIANNTNEITNLKERVDQLEECCNCKGQQISKGNLVSPHTPKNQAISTDNNFIFKK